jgi:hypothetical protein
VEVELTFFGRVRFLGVFVEETEDWKTSDARLEQAEVGIRVRFLGCFRAGPVGSSGWEEAGAPGRLNCGMARGPVVRLRRGLETWGSAALHPRLI